MMRIRAVGQAGGVVLFLLAALAGLCCAAAAPGPAPAPGSGPGSGPRSGPGTRRAAAVAAPYDCRWTDEAITIDGRGSAKAWQSAAVIDHFTLAGAVPGGVPGAIPGAVPGATRARLLWDREYLYFLVEMDDHDLIGDTERGRGEVGSGDDIQLFFKSSAKASSCYRFDVNAAGAAGGIFLPAKTDAEKKDHGAGFESKVVLRGTLNAHNGQAQGWTVEGRIPWSDFRRSGWRPNVDDQWAMALWRYDATTDQKEAEFSSATPRKGQPTGDATPTAQDVMAIRFCAPPDDAAGHPYGIPKRIPLTTSRVIGSPDPPDPYQVKRVYPNLKPSWPIAVANEPGSKRLFTIEEDYPDLSAVVLKVTGPDPSVGTSETIIHYDGVAYSICFHPDYVHNGYMYIGLNEPFSKEEGRQCKIKRYTVGRTPPYAVDLKSEKTIIQWPSNGHNGAAVTFGHDGMMYVTSGDGTSDSDEGIVGQDLSRLTSKVLRIDVDHPAPGSEYSVPKDNPFFGQPNVRPETWAYGLRNPWRMTTDAKTGAIWVGNNGQDLWESAYLIQRGANYGWSVLEGSHPFYPNRKPGPTPFVAPTVERPHSESRSLTGGIVYYGSKLPELRGVYLYGDYSTGKIWGIKVDGNKVLWDRELATTVFHITGFGTDADGEVLILDHHLAGQTGIFTLQPTPPTATHHDFPRRLSESGLFKSVAGHVVQPGLIPYDVNAPLWSDGAYKVRYLAIPGDGPAIGMTRSNGWEFPDGTVAVKSFALEMEEGNPASRKWIETRFLTRQNHEWVGYSYLWNDQQTDATLVESPGMDRQYTIHVAPSAAHPDGTRVQTWHYPSRTECMVCHSRAANYVLGLSTAQLNRDFDYGTVRDNQLREFEHLGLFRPRSGPSSDDDEDWEEVNAPGGGTGEKAHAHRPPVHPALLTRPPDKLPRLADPYDPKADLTERARAYLYSNCAQCHVPAGGGNAQFDVNFGTQLYGMNLVEVVPQHNTFDLPDARLIAAGHPERSVLLYRISRRGANQMPPLATSVVDEKAVAMLKEWIATVKPPPGKPKAAPRGAHD